MSIKPRRLQPDAHIFDDVVNKSLNVDADGKGMVISSLTHQDCTDILDHNKEVMAGGGSRTASFGKVELCIPELELANIKKRFPDLIAPDMEIRVRAWKKYLALAESKPWRVSQPRYH